MPFALDTLPPAPVLVPATAFGYALATVGMKQAADGNAPSGIVLATVGFLLAFLAEIMLMRRADLPVVYIAIIAAETFLVLSYALFIGEGLSLRQFAGVALVLAGLAAITA